MNSSKSLGSPGQSSPQKTVAQVMGEITWLVTQSQLHKNMFISDL